MRPSKNQKEHAAATTTPRGFIVVVCVCVQNQNRSRCLAFHYCKGLHEAAALDALKMLKVKENNRICVHHLIHLSVVHSNNRRTDVELESGGASVQWSANTETNGVKVVTTIFYINCHSG